jgi:hypothetical protein
LSLRSIARACFGVPAAMRLRIVASIALCAFASACGQDLYVGSDLLWSARYEGGTVAEWTDVGGTADARSPNAIVISGDRAHGGHLSAKLSVSTPLAGVQQDASFGRSSSDGPLEAYYSAWYYLPSRVSVGVFWVIMKFRTRRVLTDPATSDELYDLNLRTLPSGDMSLRLYSHRTGGDLPLSTVDPIVPVGRWFQIEAFYRNAADNTGRVTYWLDAQQVADIAARPVGPTPWVGWNVCSIAENLTPTAADLFVDDVAISRTRVGPTGVLVP